MLFKCEKKRLQWTKRSWNTNNCLRLKNNNMQTIGPLADLGDWSYSTVRTRGTATRSRCPAGWESDNKPKPVSPNNSWFSTLCLRIPEKENARVHTLTRTPVDPWNRFPSWTLTSNKPPFFIKTLSSVTATLQAAVHLELVHSTCTYTWGNKPLSSAKLENPSTRKSSTSQVSQCVGEPVKQPQPFGRTNQTKAMQLVHDICRTTLKVNADCMSLSQLLQIVWTDFTCHFPNESYRRLAAAGFHSFDVKHDTQQVHELFVFYPKMYQIWYIEEVFRQKT